MQRNNKLEIPSEIPEEKQYYISVFEALIFSSESPLSIQRLRDLIPDFGAAEIRATVDYLNALYRENGHSFEIREIAGGYQMFTLPEYASFVKQLYQDRQQSRLTHKALETLSIIAYKQPITRHEIEDIRGVNVDGVVRTLLSRNLVTIAGRAQAPGSPFLYKTTKKFLDYFGLNSLDDLPQLKEIEELIDVEDEGHPHHETLLKEITPNELGMRVNGNGSDDKESDQSEQEKED